MSEILVVSRSFWSTVVIGMSEINGKASTADNVKEKVLALAKT
jgi:hypothetical protein